MTTAAIEAMSFSQSDSGEWSLRQESLLSEATMTGVGGHARKADGCIRVCLPRRILDLVNESRVKGPLHLARVLL